MTAVCNAKFYSDGGRAVSAQKVESGKTATKPADPTKDGYSFLGWYNGDKTFDFATAITAARKRKRLAFNFFSNFQLILPKNQIFAL